MKIGIVTFTDGRARVAKATDKDCRAFQERLVSYFKRKKHEVVAARKIVWNYKTARDEARRIDLAYPDVVVFNFCVWSFPDLTAQVANLLPGVPILLVGNVLPSHPGWVAFFASAGTLDEMNVPFGRVLELSNESGRDEPRERPVQRARVKAPLATGPLLHGPHDRITMRFTAQEREQDIERDRCQRQQFDQISSR